ncbi:MAG: hypothetical protein QOF30_2469 [Acidimicrobiaceae bacterium]|nr:hypothetical protein [Acidimicrobiaceae bacterium]
MISVGVVRTAALVVCVAGIAGMIVTSILNHNGAAVTFGLVTAVAVLCSMVAKAVAADAERRLAGGQVGPGVVPGGAGPGGAGPGGSTETAGGEVDVDALAELVEGQVQAMIAAGADEAAVRQLVGEAVRLGRILAPLRPVKDGSH